MNKATQAMLQRTIQASILAFLFWIGQSVMGWPWLLYLSIATLVYAIITLLYALFLWHQQ
ncbi:hypothetical protein [Lacticaseibacillus porcinae]|uniref:hypothetical protein n=1 Tax=Lacticaseibacillus porcinae TaxID=1123687 RepID=UPI000F7AE9A6|nr:hypothetical protein [Lacticaseibacillus porcinae]